MAPAIVAAFMVAATRVSSLSTSAGSGPPRRAVAAAAAAAFWSDAVRAMPKSMMMASASFSIITLAGLRSRWTTPASCAALRPDAT